MARPSVAEKDVITVDDAIAYWHLSRFSVRKYLINVKSADYLAFYRGRKLILKTEFEKFLR